MNKNNKTAKNKRFRVLHIAFLLHGVDTREWVMNIFQRITRDHVEMDFLAMEDEAETYADVVSAAGGALYTCPSPSNKGAFLRAFRKILEEHGPYDAVHLHAPIMRGPIMMQALRAGVLVRITHAHRDRRKARRKAGRIRRFFDVFARHSLKRLSTHGLADSTSVAADVFGKNYKNDKRWQVMPCGLDLAPFEKNVGEQAEENLPEKIKNNLGIHPSAKVIGHAGNFYFEKNHDFLVRLFAHMAKKDLKLILLLVGDGPLKEKIKQQVFKFGLETRVIFAKCAAGDMPDLLSVMDLFISPSLSEDDGRSLISAQASGLRCLVSDTVSRGVRMNDDLMTFVPLGDDIEEWARASKALLAEKKFDKKRALEIIQSSSFNVDYNVTQIEELYRSLSGRVK